MKYYLVNKGENFEEAIKSHVEPFEDMEEVKEFVRLFYGPGVEYLVCDENGGLVYVGIGKGGSGYA